MVITVSGNHCYWAMYHMKVACVLLGTNRLKIFIPGSPPLTSALSVTLAPEVTQKLLPGHMCYPQQSLELLLSTAVNL